MLIPGKTPEHEAATLDVAVRDAMQPLRDAAVAVESLAARLRIAADRGDTEMAISLGDQLSTDETQFGKAYTAWLGARPDRPGFWASRPPTPPADGKPAVTGGGSDDDRMSC